MLRPRFLPRFSVVITDFYPHLIAVPIPKSSHTLQLIFNTIFQVARHNQVLVPRPVPSPCPLPSRGPPSRASPRTGGLLVAVVLELPIPSFPHMDTLSRRLPEKGRTREGNRGSLCVYKHLHSTLTLADR